MKKLSLYCVALLLLVAFSCGGTATTREPAPTDETEIVVEEPQEEVAEDIEPVEEEPTEEAEAMSVIDYYYDIPIEYLDPPIGEDMREPILESSYVDEDNYYIELDVGLFLDGSMTFTVFVAEDGNDVVAIDTRGCGPMCEQWLTFLRYDDGVYTDITDEVLPEHSTDLVYQWDLFEEKYEATYGESFPDDMYYNILYTLPQHGTTFYLEEVYSDIQLLEVTWDWASGTFTSKEL